MIIGFAYGFAIIIVFYMDITISGVLGLGFVIVMLRLVVKSYIYINLQYVLLEDYVYYILSVYNNIIWYICKGDTIQKLTARIWLFTHDVSDNMILRHWIDDIKHV